jgi:hypothetical protein
LHRVTTLHRQQVPKRFRVVTKHIVVPIEKQEKQECSRYYEGTDADSRLNKRWHSLDNRAPNRAVFDPRRKILRERKPDEECTQAEKAFCRIEIIRTSQVKTRDPYHQENIAHQRGNPPHFEQQNFVKEVHVLPGVSLSCKLLEIL